MTEQVASAGVVSTETASPEVKDKPQTQPLTEERVTELLTKEVTKVTDALTRKFQSEKDKAIAAIRREADQHRVRADVAEETLANLSAEGVDPQTLELVKLKARDKQSSAAQAEEAKRQQVQAFDKAFYDAMAEHLNDLGIKPDDQGIDWGTDAPDYLVKQRKILASAARIQKARAHEAEEKLRKEVKETEARLRKDLGLDEVDTTTPVHVPKDTSKMSAHDLIAAGLKEKAKKK